MSFRVAFGVHAEGLYFSVYNVPNPLRYQFLRLGLHIPRKGCPRIQNAKKYGESLWL